MRHVEKMRPAQERARLILDIEHSAPDVDVPGITNETDRARLEHAARTLARQLLDQPTREYLLALEQAQANAGLAELGLADDSDPTDTPDVPDSIERLHQAVTIAQLIQTSPLTVGS